MDAETLVSLETLDRLHQDSEPEVLVKLTVSDACKLAIYLAPAHKRFGMHWAARVRSALCNSTAATNEPGAETITVVSLAVHTDAGGLRAARIIDASEATG